MAVTQTGGKRHGTPGATQVQVTVGPTTVTNVVNGTVVSGTLTNLAPMTGLTVGGLSSGCVKLPGGGEEAVARNDVKFTRASKLSMMPEGIENLLSGKDLADLFAFLSLDKPPSDPTARPIPGAPEILLHRQ